MCGCGKITAPSGAAPAPRPAPVRSPASACKWLIANGFAKGLWRGRGGCHGSAQGARMRGSG
ncbi:MAG: hypothetical protein Kow0058_08780 [Roseovarius sp.]